MLVGEGLYCHVGTRVLVIESLLLGQLIASQSNGNISGILMEFGLNFRLQQVVEEGCHAIFGILGMTGHGPDCGTTDNGILRGTLNIGPVRQYGHAPGELGTGLDGSIGP